MEYLMYVRRSSEDKNKQVQSIEKQLDWCNRKARQRNLKITKTYQDIKSGSKLGRAGFAEMMTHIEESDTPIGIICWKISRLSRNPLDEGALKYAFIRGKIKHIIASDREYREGENQIVMGVDFGQATQFSIELGRDVKEGMEKKVEKGWYPGFAPVGYKNDPHGLKGERKIFVDEERFRYIQLAWKYYLNKRYTVRELVNVFNEKWKITMPNGRKFSRTTIYNMLNNPFYCGYFKWDGRVTKGKHKPAVTRTEFRKVQELLGKRAIADTEKRHEYIFTGVFKCGACGSTLNEYTKIKKIKTTGELKNYSYLRCLRTKDVNCPQKQISVPNVIQSIIEYLKNTRTSEKIYQWLSDTYSQTTLEQDTSHETDLERFQKEIVKIEKKFENLDELLVSEVFTKQQYEKMKGKLEVEMDSVKELIKKKKKARKLTPKDFQKLLEEHKNVEKNFTNGSVRKKGRQ